jgi:hypothetical protein
LGILVSCPPSLESPEVAMHPGGLFAGPLGRRLLQYAVAGTAGNLIVRGGSRLAPRVTPVARRLAVGAVAQGIVLGRRLTEVAEETRLGAGDVVAEARASLGEEAPPPVRPVRGEPDHGHEH